MISLRAFPARRTAAARPSFWRWRRGALWAGRGGPARRPPAVLDRCAALASSSRAGPAGGLPTGAVHTHAAQGRRPDRRRLGGEGHAPLGSAPRRVRQLEGGGRESMGGRVPPCRARRDPAAGRSKACMAGSAGLWRRPGPKCPRPSSSPPPAAFGGSVCVRGMRAARPRITAVLRREDCKRYSTALRVAGQ